MKKKGISLLSATALLLVVLSGCGGQATVDSSSATAQFDSEPSSAVSASEEAASSVTETVGEDGVKLSDDASDFVLLSEAVPDAILEIRYYSTYNFVGDRIDGYEEPLAFLTKEAASSLKEVSDELVSKGY